MATERKGHHSLVSGYEPKRDIFGGLAHPRSGAHFDRANSAFPHLMEAFGGCCDTRKWLSVPFDALSNFGFNGDLKSCHERINVGRLRPDVMFKALSNP